MGQFGDTVSAMKYEMCFPWECHQSAKVRTAAQRVSLALVPDLSNYVVFIAIRGFGSAITAYHGFGSAITAYSYTHRQPMARKYDVFLD